MVGMIRSCLPKLSSCLPNGSLVGGLGHPETRVLDVVIVYLLRQLICNRPADFVIGPRGPITKSVIGPRGPITDFVWFYMERSERL